jgi:hypothetical protein
MAGVDVQPLPAADHGLAKPLNAPSEHSFLRGDPDIRPSKTGVQKRIDALVRLRHNLEAQINERDQCIATLQATNEAQSKSSR